MSALHWQGRRLLLLLLPIARGGLGIGRLSLEFEGLFLLRRRFPTDRSGVRLEIASEGVFGGGLFQYRDHQLVLGTLCAQIIVSDTSK